MGVSDSTLARRTLFFLFTCGTVAGCAATDRPDEAPSVDSLAATPVATPEPLPQDTAPPPLDPVAFPEQVRLELAALTNGTTPDMWIESHPNDEMQLFEHDPILAWGGWCVRMSGQVALSDGGRLTREAYFYPPLPPTDLQLPDPADGRRLALSECQLGSVWVEAAESDPERARLLVTAAAAEISSVYGPATDHRASFFASSSWRGTSRWRLEHQTLVSAYNPGLLDGGGGRIVTYGLLPISGPPVRSATALPEVVGEVQRKAMLRTANRVASLDAATVAAVDSIVAGAESWQRVSRGGLRSAFLDPEPLVATVTRITEGIDPADATGHAARLVAADLLHSIAVRSAGLWHLPRYLLSLQPQTDTVRIGIARDSLRALGAHYERHGEPAAAFVYTHEWLHEAWRLDSSGPAGGIAFEWLTDRSCDGAGVIAQGEGFLERLDDGAFKARLHFLVAEAYRDIVALSGGAHAEYVDPQDYQSESEMARMKAIEHYGAALAGDLDSTLAREAWAEAWRLVADLVPMHTRFFCIND